MDRIKLQCLLSGVDTSLQFDKKSMPGEAGPCYMITANGSFKGYISRRENGSYQSLGTAYYANEDLEFICAHLVESLAGSLGRNPSKI
ncbi:hypothetical protein [Mucilaginibacter gynuensis]|uniref:hypothetical protein n=1 Tax=Mucilaginibacter gynuensis TaxID=1302236 RepID=UPI0031EEDF8B